MSADALTDERKRTTNERGEVMSSDALPTSEAKS
jgi:hypothetical protein